MNPKIRAPRTLRFQLVLAVNSVLLLLVVVLLMYDYRRELNDRFAEEKIARDTMTRQTIILPWS